MTNIISLIYSRFFLLLFVGMLPACALQKAPQPQPAGFDGYRSELADPEAKAFYAYVEFRMLAAENRWEEAIAALQRAVTFDEQTPYLRMNLAKALLHKDQTDESIVLLRQILEQQPDNVEGHELLGDLLGYQGDNEAAVEHYRQALQVDPDNEMLRMRLAMAYGRLGQNLKAIELLEKMIAEQPEAKLARLSLARFYLEIKETDKASAAFQQLVERYPDYQQAVLEFGQLLERQKLFAEAFSLYRQAIKENPRLVMIRQQLAMLYLRQNRKAEALEQLQSVRQLMPGNLQVTGRIGLLQLDMENWAVAEADFRQLLETGEGDGRNRYYLGLALLGQQKYQQAIEVMAPIDDSSPVFAEAVIQLAYLYRQSGELDKAIGGLEQLLAQNIQRPEIYFYLTSYYADHEQLDNAADAVSRGLKQFPDNIDLLYQSAVVQEKKGNRKMALQQMEQILAIDPGHAEALNFIAYHHAEKGTRLELALSQAKQALTSKKTGYIVDTLGWIYFKMGRYQESRQQLEEATSLLPEDPVILEHLGDLYRALMLWEDAAAAYRKSLELDPLAVGVEEKLEALPLEMDK
ncbi:Tetratricopeptide repeat-containing protein [Malonomonas rubra DSM 5091]|uniref:Tetratricopeptide repeat-containing protein n=1 Tax=Malonomonas rubra DSM 5091 TaxID=1122189 RepID=A0A1M6CAE5_MALRU|nr:tetratricopeptide repeat protein [Malonomonas rubra]SHI58005.1 Tetratricopeptide repeat-containing protein [Malonomonas rubra DSM 5091]